MTPSEHKAERDKAVLRVASDMAKALPEHFGSVEVMLQNGKVAAVKLNESIRPG